MAMRKEEMASNFRNRQSVNRIKIDEMDYIESRPTDRQEKGEKIIRLNLDSLIHHPLEERLIGRLNRESDKFKEIKASIETSGVIMPIVVRPYSDGVYQVLAGHRRVEASRDLGLKEIPAIIRNVNDEKAIEIFGNSNHEGELSEIDWGYIFREEYDLQKKKTGRHKNESHGGTHFEEESTEENESHRGTHFGKTDEEIAKKYGFSRNTVNRRIRLTYLHQTLQLAYLEKTITLKVAVELSYLRTEEQYKLCKLMECYVTDEDGNKVKALDVEPLTLEIAKELKQASKSATDEYQLTLDDIESILYKKENEAEEQIDIAQAKLPKPKKYVVESHLFPIEIKENEKANYIAKALMYIKENDIEL